MPPKILEEFDLLAIPRDRPSMHLTDHPSKSIIFRAAWDASLRELRILLKKERRFFKRFKYDWVKLQSSYRFPLEAALQLRVLQAMSDISPAHPNFGNLANVCVRIVGAGGVGVECILKGEYRYILVSTSFVKYIWEFVHCLAALNPSTCSFEVGGSGGDFRSMADKLDLPTLVQTQRKEIDSLISLALMYNRSQIPENLPNRYTDAEEMELKGQGFIAVMVHAADTFAVFHELGHLLSPKLYGGTRHLEKEIEADASALSLSIILASKMPGVAVAVVIGPACIFGLLKHLALCRAAFATVEGGGDASDEELMAEMEEICRREAAFVDSLLIAGLPPEIAELYRQWCREFRLVMDVTSLRLRELSRARPPANPENVP